MKRFLIIWLLTIQAFFSLAAADTLPGTFSPEIKTLQVRNPDNFMTPPIIRLSTSDRLWINFDIIGNEHEYLRYKVIHCNADWQPSRLLESEYLSSFNEGEITDYAYSSNTYIHYVNYNIEIPNEDMEFLRGGNYLLQVYPEGNPDDILLQERFSVTENSLGVSGNVTSHTDKGYNSEFQQVNVIINGLGAFQINPYQDLIVTVTQNNRPETQRTVSHPMRADRNSAIFEHDFNLIFNAGNEYRRFETVRTDYPGMHMDSVKYGGTNWHAYLKEDESRYDKDYSYDSTQKGRFKIDEYNSSDPDLGADYVTVHFNLDAPQIIGGDIYLDGDFTNHRFNDSNRLKYDFNTGNYTLQMPLKQGSYNYQYVAVPQEGPAIPDPTPLEGNKYETHNEYLIQVFLRQPTDRADRLVGSAQLIF